MQKRDAARIFHHVGEQFAEQRHAHRVDFLVAPPHVHRLVDVARRIGIQHALELGQHQRAHMLDAADQLQRRIFAVQVEHALADILGKVADPLDLVGDAQAR